MFVDRIGIELAIDDVVAVAKNDMLVIGKVTKFNPKRLKILPLSSSEHWRITKEFSAYPVTVIRLDPQAALLFLLKKDAK